jgi:hypothetical protein
MLMFVAMSCCGLMATSCQGSGEDSDQVRYDHDLRSGKRAEMDSNTFEDLFFSADCKSLELVAI